MLALKAANFRVLASSFFAKNGVGDRSRGRKARLLAEAFQAAADDRGLNEAAITDETVLGDDAEAIGANVSCFQAQHHQFKRNRAVEK